MPDEDLDVGSRVYSSAVGQEGVVVRRYGTDMATVRFPTGERTVPISTLTRVVVDPFELLGAGSYGDEPEWFDIRLRAARIQAAYGSDNLSGLSNSRVLLKPHQIFVAHRILEKPRPSMILADEVGLGKTVQAGLVMKELLARRSVERILVIAPPNLLNQWQNELRIKFNEQFEIVDSAMLVRARQLARGNNPWLRFNRALVSLHLARKEEVREDLAGAAWDLVVLDEAHHCRRKADGATLLYRTLERLKDDAFGVMLLTATPMQLHPMELYGLVEIVEPGLYQGYEEFQEEAFASQDLRRAVRTLQAWDEASEAERRHAMAQLDGARPDLRSPLDRERATHHLLERLRLTQAIVRNRKRTVGGFTRRRAQTVLVDLTDEELEVHSALTDYVRRGYRAARDRRDSLLGLELVVFQRLLASSSRALSVALRNRLQRLLGERARTAELTDDPDEPTEGSTTLVLGNHSDEVSTLRRLIEALEKLADSKVAVLERLVRKILAKDPTEKILIFTQFLATQQLICERLAGLSVVKFHGGMSRWDKDAAVLRFKREAQVMVSTESGGEGRNFQFCHILINFDLHWNPMRIEQRIGRLDRYGQRRNVHVYNLAARGTIEEQLLAVFEHRLNLFEATVGALELVLGEMEDDLRQALIDAAGSVDDAVERFERALELRLDDARRVEEKSADFLIELASYRPHEADRLTEELRQGRVQTDLELLILKLLRRFPTARVEPDGDAYQITVPPALPRAVGVHLERVYRGTFSAAIAVDNEDLDFFGFGHPLVDACLRYAEAEASAGLVAVRRLPGGALQQPAIESHWVLEFSGVRKWARVESIVLALDGTRLVEAEERLALAEPFPDAVVGPDAATVERLRERAIAELRRVADAERPAVAERNQRHAAQERSRATRIFRYNRRRIEDRAARLRAQIQALQAEGNPERLRIVPALQGQIEALGRELADHEASLEERLREIDARSMVSESFRLVSAALLVPGPTTG